MPLIRLALLLVILAIAPGQSGPARPEYAAGQVWQYRTRAGDEGSLVKIVKIETDPAFFDGEPVFHITVIGVHVGSVRHVVAIAHLPVSKETLDKSLTTVVDSKEYFPDPAPGIQQWREVKGGVFTASIAEIVQITDLAAAAQRVRP